MPCHELATTHRAEFPRTNDCAAVASSRITFPGVLVIAFHAVLSCFIMVT